MRMTIAAALATATLSAAAMAEEPVPDDFVWLSDVAPTIEQDIRYYGSHNFLGRPVAGYEAPECILTRQAAEALLAASGPFRLGREVLIPPSLVVRGSTAG